MKQSLIIAALSAMRLIASSVMQAYIFAVLGLGLHTDALIASAVLPQLVTTLIVNALMQILVPIFSADRPEEQHRDAWALVVLLLSIFGAIALVLAASARVWTAWLVPGFPTEGKTLTADLAQIQLVSVIFTVPFAVLWSLHCAREKLIRAESLLALSSLVSFAALVIALPRWGVQAAAAVAVLRAMLDFGLLMWVLGRWHGMHVDMRFARMLWRRLKYLLAGSAYYGTEPLVNQLLASFAPVGGLSTFFLGQQLYSVSSQIVNKAFAAPLLPGLSIAAHHDRWADFLSMYRRRLSFVGCVAVAALIAVAVLGNPVINALAGRVTITVESLRGLWQVLLALFGMCIGGLVGQVTVGALLAMGDARTVTRLGVITYTLYLPLKVFAFQWGGLTGLALAASAFYLANMVGQHVLTERAVARALRGAPIPLGPALPLGEKSA